MHKRVVAVSTYVHDPVRNPKSAVHIGDVESIRLARNKLVCVTAIKPLIIVIPPTNERHTSNL